VLLRQSQADDPNSVFIRAFGEHQNVQPVRDQAEGNEPPFVIVETVVFSFERGVPSKIDCCLERHTMLLAIGFVPGRIKLDLHDINVHPINGAVKDKRTASFAVRARPWS